MTGSRAEAWVAVAFAAGGLACAHGDPAVPSAPPHAVVVDVARADASAAVVDAAKTASAIASRLVRITGRESHAMHTHGCDPAHVSDARFAVQNDDDVEHVIRVESVDYLVDHGVQPCTGVASTFFKQLPPSGIRFDDADAGFDMKTFVVVPPHAERGVVIGFSVADAYYTYCDTFAFRAVFRVEGIAGALIAVAPLSVMREEPWRP